MEQRLLVELIDGRKLRDDVPELPGLGDGGCDLTLLRLTRRGAWIGCG